MASKPLVVCLLGPTASGKTAVAAELVQRLPMEIISVDATQIYRGLDIGSGKPDGALLARAPHRLIDILDPAESYSAARFRQDAVAHIEAIRTQGRTPLLAGGTALYFKVLRDGLASLPAADPVVRAEIEAEAAERGWPAVHAQLAQVDPGAAARIHPNDPQRLQRALEVYRVSGRTLTDFHRKTAATEDPIAAPLPYRFLWLAIQPTDRAVLHARIADRFEDMLSRGLVNEVAALRARGDLSLTLPSMRSVGYRQVWQFLDGQLTYDEMVERGIIATRQLAKRQLTWLRSWVDLNPLPVEPDESVMRVTERALKVIETVSI